MEKKIESKTGSSLKLLQESLKLTRRPTKPENESLALLSFSSWTIEGSYLQVGEKGEQNWKR